MSTATTAPTPAERVRSALAAATSVHALWDDGAEQLDGAPGVLDDGDVVLRAERTGALGERLVSADGVVGLVLTVTDVAPLAVLDRVRGRVLVAGRARLLGSDDDTRGHVTLRLRPEQVRWQSAAPRGRRPRPAQPVPVAEHRAARPDPLAADEADVLLELAACPERLRALAAHVPGCVVQDPVRPPLPLRLDQHGVVLRTEGRDAAGATRLVDARLPFAHPATTPALAWAALEELLERV